MTPRIVRLCRGAVGFGAILVLGSMVALALLSRLAPLSGHELFVVAGGSMEPAIPLGSMVVVSRTDPRTIAVGDVVTIRADNGVVITHRVTRTLIEPTTSSFELKGDANATADPTLVSARALVGRVTESVPLVGYLLAFLSGPPGMIVALSLVAVLVLAFALLGTVAPEVRVAGPDRPRGDLEAIRP